MLVSSHLGYNYRYCKGPLYRNIRVHTLAWSEFVISIVGFCWKNGKFGVRFLAIDTTDVRSYQPCARLSSLVRLNQHSRLFTTQYDIVCSLNSSYCVPLLMVYPVVDWERRYGTLTRAMLCFCRGERLHSFWCV